MEEGKLSIPPLGIENYAPWSTRMEAASEYKGLWEYVENDLKEDGNTKSDRKARGSIVMKVKDQHLSVLAKCQKAKQAWDALARTHAAKSSARILLVEKDFNHLDKPLTMYFCRVRDIRDQLATAGEPIIDEKVSRQVLLDSLVKMRFWPLYWRPLRRNALWRICWPNVWWWSSGTYQLQEKTKLISPKGAEVSHQLAASQAYNK